MRDELLHPLAPSIQPTQILRAVYPFIELPFDVFVMSSLDFVFLEVGALQLLYVLIVLHDHELPECKAHPDTGRVVLERWRTDLSCNCTHREKQEASQGDYMEVSSLVALVLIVEVHEVCLSDAATVVKALQLLGPGVNFVVLRCHLRWLSVPALFCLKLILINKKLFSFS